MRLSECIFQGVAGLDGVTRLRPQGKVAEVALPAGLSVEALQGLITCCLYPTMVDEAWLERLGVEEGSKLAVVLSGGKSTFRVLRRGDEGSVRLQRRKGDSYRDVVRGARDVERALREKLGMPAPEVFYPLGLWRFEGDDIPAPKPGAKFGDDPQIPEVVEQFRLALEVEALEDKLKALEGRIEEGEKALGKTSKLEAKRDEVRAKLTSIAVDELSDEELALLESKEERLDEFYKQLDRFGEQESRTLDAIAEELPGRPWRGPILWAGLVIVLAALGSSVALEETHRWVAVGAIPGFALAGFAWLRYYHGLGQASLHKVRLDSIRRRIIAVREEEIFFRERLDHVLFHAGVDNVAELQERLPQAKKLRKIAAKIEDKLEELEQDPAYRQAVEKLDRLRAERRELEATREEYPDFVMNSFRLEEDLEQLGVEPDEVRRWAASQGGVTDEEQGWMDVPLRWLHHVAEVGGQYRDGQLSPSVQKMWSKVCGHLLSPRFDELGLSEDGDLQVEGLTEEQIEMWASTRKAERRTVERALALALQVDRQKRSKGPKGFGAIWMEAPSKRLSGSIEERFGSVFQSAGRHAQIVICREE